jgi:signal transduction histidine kinase
LIESSEPVAILLVEDNARHAGLIREELQVDMPDAEVSVADGVRAARDALLLRSFDLVVLDFRLPDGDGLEILRDLRQAGRSEAVVFVTTSTSAEIAVEAMKIGADDYVVKEEGYVSILPFVVREVLDRSRLRRERAALERRLARAEHLASLNTLMAGIAHNLNNPLTTVRTFLELLPSRYETDAEFRTSYYELVLKELARIRALIGSMMQAVAIPAEGSGQPWHLAGLVRDVEAYVRGVASEKGIRFECRPAASLPSLVAGREAVKQALIVLLDNAIAFSPNEGVVTLDCRIAESDSGRRVVLEVSDEGPGIAPQDQKKIFDPFFSTRPGGIGIGLFVAHCVARAHGGSLDFSARSPRGARFALSLPVES